MQSVRAYYDGNKFVPIETVNVKKNQAAIITILDESLNKEGNSKPFTEFIGRLSDESCFEITEALKQTEKVDIDEW